MNDTLRYLKEDPVHRQYHHNLLTFSLMYAYSENYLLPISHDEVVHGKGSLWGRVPGDDWRKAATLRAYFAYQWAHPGKKLLFMGGELGNPREWSEAAPVPWELAGEPLHGGIQRLIGDLNRLYRATPALHVRDFAPEGFRWIDANDSSGNVLAFIRWSLAGEPLVCLANFSAVPHDRYRVGLPMDGTWREVLNTDAAIYGGSGVGNLGHVTATAAPLHGLEASAAVVLPPLGAIWLMPDITT
jgi:1,4-alpha-glucan branching enzyme